MDDVLRQSIREILPGCIIALIDERQYGDGGLCACFHSFRRSGIRTQIPARAIGQEDCRKNQNREPKPDGQYPAPIAPKD